MKRIAATIMLFAFLMPAAFAVQDNMIKNGDFSDGYTGWSDFKNDEGAYKVSVENGVLKAEVLSPGENPWSIGIFQTDISLQKGMVYTVKFSAKGNTPGPIKILVQKSDEPYTCFSGTHAFKPGKKIKEYTFTFTMRHETEAKASLQFMVGKSGKGEVFISNVSMVNQGAQPALVIPDKFPRPFVPKMKRGVNFGNTLDAPTEGEWGPELREDYFDIIKNKGVFDTIRIPCRWETRSMDKPPYTIDPEFMKRVDWAVSNALSRGFYVVLNMHHHLMFENQPVQQKERWLAMWKQIAEHFVKYPDNLMFEIYNEPGTHLSDKTGTLEDVDIWNKLWPEAFRVIRESNPLRTIVISGPNWASPDRLTYLEVPDDIEKDPNKIMQFHFYYPADFCFQGAQGSGFESTSGIRWKGESQEKDAIKYKFYVLTKWAKEHNYKLWNGEFTAFAEKSVPSDRLKWISYVASQCEENDIPWCYWDFAGDASHVYDPDANAWDEDVIKAMTGKIKEK